MADYYCLKKRAVELFKNKSLKDRFLPWIYRTKETKLAILHRKLLYSETRNKGRAQGHLVTKISKTTSNRIGRTIGKEQTFKKATSGLKTPK
jgi:hypothetical protein